MDIITAVRELTRFDHGACDTSIVSHHVHFNHFMFKGGSSFEEVYVGSAFITVWSAGIVAVTIWAYRNRRALVPRFRVWLWFGPLMCVFAVVCIVAQADGLIEYAEVCRSLLRLS